MKLIGHYDEITDVRFFQWDVGKECLIVATNSHDVFVVDPATHSSKTLTAHTDIVLAVDISPEHDAIATVSKVCLTL